MTDSKDQAVTPSPKPQTPVVVPLGQGGSIDLSWMPEEQRTALVTNYAQGLLDTSQKANELNVEVGILHKTLSGLAENTKQMAQDGLSVTATHTHSSKFGRTEVIVGNTETAGKGKLSKSQAGERDWTPYYIFAGLAVFVIIAMIVAGHR